MSLPPYNPPKYRAKLNGCRCDGQSLFDVTVTNGSAVVSSASYQFTGADIGKVIGVFSAYPAVLQSNGTFQGPSASSGALIGTILSVSGGAATISATAAASIAGTAYAVFGTDDSAALTSLISAVSASGGGVIELEDILVVSNTVTIKSNVSLVGQDKFATKVYYISPNATTTGVFVGSAGSSSTPYYNVAFSNFTIDGSFVFVAAYNVAVKAIFAQWMVRLSITDMYVFGTIATGIGVDFLQESIISRNIVEFCGRGGDVASGATGASGIGVATYGNTVFGPETSICSENVVVMPTYNGGNYGIFYEANNGTFAAPSSIVVSNNAVKLNLSGQIGIGASGTDGMAIVGNRVTAATLNGSSLAGTTGISLDVGTVSDTRPPQSCLVAGNYVSQVSTGIYMYWPSNSASSVYPVQFSDNYIWNVIQYGYQFVNNGASNVANDMVINGGSVDECGSAGIGFLAGANNNMGYGRVSIKGVNGSRNGAGSTHHAGVYIASPINNFRMSDCAFYDGGASVQLYGIQINGVAVTNAFLVDNDLSGNTSTAISLVASGTISGWIANNKGYNPVGPATISVSASPYTYTAGNTPETVYISGGTVSSVTKGGVTLASATGTQVQMQPGDAIVVTYSSAPTMVTDKH